MGLFQRGPKPIRGRVLVGFYGLDAPDAAYVQWVGNRQATDALVPAYLDKILFNTSVISGEQERLLARVEQIISSSPARLMGYGPVPQVGLVRLVSTHRASPLAVITADVEVNEKKGLVRTRTEIHPANEKLAELGLWTLWDWMVGDGHTAFVRTLDNQCRYYRAKGMPTLSTLGRAPFASLSVPSPMWGGAFGPMNWSEPGAGGA